MHFFAAEQKLKLSTRIGRGDAAKGGLPLRARMHPSCFEKFGVKPGFLDSILIP